VNYVALLLSSIIIDRVPYILGILNISGPSREFRHSFLGATIISIILAILIYPFMGLINMVTKYIKLSQKSPLGVIFISCLLGTYLHVVMDSMVYDYLKPFLPFAWNPFYGIASKESLEMFCRLSFILGGLLYIVKLTRETREEEV